MWWLTGLACSPPSPPPSIVLVTLDTTRADRIGSYGYEKGYTPNIDKFAREGVRFDAAYTTVPLTSAAHASILTGMYPSHTGVHANGDAALPAEIGTIAEYLQANGYYTMASVSAFVTTRLWNFDQGFDFYADKLNPNGGNSWGQQRPAPAVMLDVEQHLFKISKDKPLFLWIHLYDPHLPWMAPGIWANKGADAYDGEIAFSDAQIGRVEAWIRKAVGDRVIWVIAGDHGEGLEGDLEEGHGMYLRQETIRVPFILRPAEPLSEPIVVSEAVSLVDIAPTVLALAGIDAPPRIDGVDLSPALEGELPAREPVVVESELPRLRLGWAPEVAVIDESLKLYDTPDARLYDLSTDPGEERNLLSERAADVERLRKVAAAVRQEKPVGQSHDMGGISAQLEALGYLSIEDSEDPPSQPIDAKTRVDVFRSLTDARAAKEGKLPGVDPVAVWRELLARDPALTEARLELVLAAERRGDRAAALALLDEGLALTPNSAALLLDRGKLLLAEGRSEEAARDANAVLARNPEHRSARDLLLSALVPEVALARIREWQQQAPDDLFLRAREGQALLELGRFEEAEAVLRLAVEAPMPWMGVHLALARVSMRTGRMPEALNHLGMEVTLFPDSVMGWLALGQAALDRNDAKTALEAYESAYALAPADKEAQRGLAEARLRNGDVLGAEALIEPLMPSDNPRVLLVHANLLKARGKHAEGDALLARLAEQAGAPLIAVQPPPPDPQIKSP